MIHLHIFLCSLLIINGIMVVNSKNPIDSIISLILCFCNTGMLLFLFKSDFIGLIYIIVYVGAVAVLFLFVVMMINEKYIYNYISKKNNNNFFNEFSKNLTQKNFLTIILTTLFAFLGFYILFIKEAIKNVYNFTISSLNLKTPALIDYRGSIAENLMIDPLSNIEIFGQVLFNNFFIYFLLCGLILLIALIGAIILTINIQIIEKKQIVYRQLSRADNFLTYFENKR